MAPPKEPDAICVFDTRHPMALSQEEHMLGYLTEESRIRSADGVAPKGLEGYMLELADLCKGFRVIVAGPTFVGIMKRYVKGFIFEERSRARPRAGTWRGYPVYVDEAVEPDQAPDDMYPNVRAHLSANASSPPIGRIVVINWGGFRG